MKKGISRIRVDLNIVILRLKEVEILLRRRPCSSKPILKILNNNRIIFKAMIKFECMYGVKYGNYHWNSDRVVNEDLAKKILTEYKDTRYDYLGDKKPVTSRPTVDKVIDGSKPLENNNGKFWPTSKAPKKSITDTDAIEKLLQFMKDSNSSIEAVLRSMRKKMDHMSDTEASGWLLSDIQFIETLLANQYSMISQIKINNN